MTGWVVSGYRFKQGPEITRNKMSELLSKYPALSNKGPTVPENWPVSPRGKHFSVLRPDSHKCDVL